jgi:hypothetical protein
MGTDTTSEYEYHCEVQNEVLKRKIRDHEIALAILPIGSYEYNRIKDLIFGWTMRLQDNDKS